MTTIQNRSSLVPAQIKEAVRFVFNGTAAEMKAQVPTILE
jgi:hypothetical protein